MFSTSGGFTYSTLANELPRSNGAFQELQCVEVSCVTRNVNWCRALLRDAANLNLTIPQQKLQDSTVSYIQHRIHSILILCTSNPHKQNETRIMCTSERGKVDRAPTIQCFRRL